MAFGKVAKAALKKKKPKKKTVKVDAAEKKPIQKRQFKKNYEVDIGKPNPTDSKIRDMPQRKVRGTSGRAADAGSDPIVVGSKSMPSFADVNAASGRAKSSLKARLRKLADDGNKAAKARLERIEKAEAQAEADRVKKSAIGRAGTKKVPDGTYVHKENGLTYDIDSSDVRVKKLPEDIENYYRNPTPNQLNQVARNIAARRDIKKKGEDQKAAIKRLEIQLTNKINREKGRDVGIDIKKGLTDAERKKLKLKKGGIAMKKKGYAKGGMKKKKGMAMGGLKKPVAKQAGLKKLPSSVRNKMGYAKNGGMMKKKGMAKGGMKKKGYAKGGMAKGKVYGSVDNRKKK